MPNAKCVANNKQDPWICTYDSVELLKHIDSPLFILNSLQDWYVIVNGLGIHCIDERFNAYFCDENEKKEFDTLRKIYIDQLEEVLKVKKTTSVWAHICSFHTYLHIYPTYNSSKFAIPHYS